MNLWYFCLCFSGAHLQLARGREHRNHSRYSSQIHHVIDQGLGLGVLLSGRELGWHEQVPGLIFSIEEKESKLLVKLIGRKGIEII